LAPRAIFTKIFAVKSKILVLDTKARLESAEKEYLNTKKWVVEKLKNTSGGDNNEENSTSSGSSSNSVKKRGC
jgi:hypothetical protein